MKKFVFEIYGGLNPQDLSKDKMKEVMSKWSTWFGANKDRVVDSGNPFGPNGMTVPRPVRERDYLYFSALDLRRISAECARLNV